MLWFPQIEINIRLMTYQICLILRVKAIALIQTTYIRIIWLITPLSAPSPIVCWQFKAVLFQSNNSIGRTKPIPVSKHESISESISAEKMIAPLVLISLLLVLTRCVEFEYIEVDLERRGYSPQAPFTAGYLCEL